VRFTLRQKFIVAHQSNNSDQRIDLPLGAVRQWIEKMEEAQRLFEFAKWLE